MVLHLGCALDSLRELFSPTYLGLEESLPNSENPSNQNFRAWNLGMKKIPGDFDVHSG